MVALGALGAAVWFFAGADEAALDRPTVADRLTTVAEAHPGEEALLVVPATLPPEWREPGVETATAGDDLTRFEVRFVRRIERPDREGVFVAVRVHVCTATAVDVCLDGRTELQRRTTDGVTTVVTVDEAQFLDQARSDWEDVVLTSDWRAVDWTTRLR